MNRNMYLLLAVFSALILSCSTNKTDIVNKSKVTELLPEGSYKFEVLDSVKTTPRQVELTYAFQKAYQEKMDTFNSYFEKVRSNKEANFPENDYLSEEDFKEYMEYAENIKLLPSTTESVKVVNSGDLVTFESSGKLEILNYIKYNTSTNTFKIEDYTLTFRDSTTVTDKENALQESWNGHTWEFAEPNDMEMPTQETISSISIKQYKITLGTLEQSGRTFMKIKGNEYKNGERILSFEIPFRMKK